MTFTSSTLGAITQPVGGKGIRFFSYSTDDDVEVVTGTGYFIDADQFGVRPGDLIFTIPETTSLQSYVLAVETIDASGNGTASMTVAVSGTVWPAAFSTYGAAGDGAADDTTAITTALAAGVPLTGHGKTYGVTGNITLPDGCWIENATFKQLSPNSASRRTLIKTSGSGPLTLKNVKVDRNSLGTHGSVADAAAIYLDGIDDVMLEDVEAWGDGPGRIIRIASGDNITLIRPYVHDVQWTADADPDTEQVVGIDIGACTNVRIDNPRVANLTSLIQWGSGQTITIAGKGRQYRWYGANAYRTVTPGTTGPTPPTHTSGTVSDGGVSWEYLGGKALAVRAYNTDGITWTGAQNVDVDGGFISNVSEGSDGYGERISLFGTIYQDCGSAGSKWIGPSRRIKCVGISAVRCGLWGIVCSGAALELNRGQDYAFINPSILDTGSNGDWAGESPAGIRCWFDGTYPPRHIDIYNPVIRDQQAVPTMKYGIMNIGDATEMQQMRVWNATIEGATISSYYPSTGWIGLYPQDTTQPGVGRYHRSVDYLTSEWTFDLVTHQNGKRASSRSTITLAVTAGDNNDIPTSPLSDVARVVGMTGNFAITGFVPVVIDGQWLHIINSSTLYTMTIGNNRGSAAANRIRTRTAADVILPAGGTASFWYDGSINLWIMWQAS